METSKKVETNWYPEKSLLVTQLSGILEKSDIEKKMTIRTSSGIQCMGVTHSHQDQTKMDLYEFRFSTEQEHYFLDPTAARD